MIVPSTRRPVPENRCGRSGPRENRAWPLAGTPPTGTAGPGTATVSTWVRSWVTVRTWVTVWAGLVAVPATVTVRVLVEDEPARAAPSAAPRPAIAPIATTTTRRFRIIAS